MINNKLTAKKYRSPTLKMYISVVKLLERLPVVISVKN